MENKPHDPNAPNPPGYVWDRNRGQWIKKELADKEWRNKAAAVWILLAAVLFGIVMYAIQSSQ